MIDSHAHLSHASFGESREPLLARAREAGLEAIVNICTTPEELEIGLELAKRYPWIYNVGSTTPHDAQKNGALHFEAFAAHARAGDLVAVGETGLDYHYFPETAEVQKEWLRRYFALALECHLPVVIHCREAFDDFFDELDKHFSGKGVLHCFTGTFAEAESVIERGWYLSLSGIVTFKKSEELRRVAARVPENRLLIETDTPYLAPTPYRGRPNEPAYLLEIAKCVAEVRGVSLEALQRVTSANACEFFSLNR